MYVSDERRGLPDTEDHRIGLFPPDGLLVYLAGGGYVKVLGMFSLDKKTLRSACSFPCAKDSADPLHPQGACRARTRGRA